MGNTANQFGKSEFPFAMLTVVVTVTGLLISVAGTIFPTVMGVSGEHSILFGIVMAAITLLAALVVELVAKTSDLKKTVNETARIALTTMETKFGHAESQIIEAHKETREMLMLEDKLLRDSWLAGFVKDISSSYFEVIAVRSEPGDYFESVMRHYLNDCRAQVDGLGQGYFMTKSDGPHSFRVLGITRVQKSMRLVQAQAPEYWTEDLGRRYTELHKQVMAEKQVSITRIWLLPKQHLMDCKAVILEHAELGINTLVLPTEWLQGRILIEDFGVIDDYMVVMPLPGGEEERISRNEQESAEYNLKWRQLFAFATEATKYYSTPGA